MRLHRSKRKRKKGDTAQLAAQLAPLEEFDKTSAAKQLGVVSPIPDTSSESLFSAIVVDNDSLQVPKDILESGDEKTYLGMEPVVIVILGVMLLFIAFIAWQITLMPAQ